MAAPLLETQVCSQTFSNDLLSRGDEAVLIAPVTDFYAEIARCNTVRSSFKALPPENPEDPASYAAQSFAAETTDLAAELRRQKTPAEESLRIRSEHAAAREKLRKYADETTKWAASRPIIYDDAGSHLGEPQTPKPEFPVMTVDEELPKEFGMYLEAAIASARDGETNENAVENWKRILELPAEERHWKSTWAAYRLGKTLETVSPAEAVNYFRQARAMATQGFADSIGLAAASLGREARVWLNQRNYAAATDLYLQQMAAGDDGAADSLRITATRALENGDSALRQLAGTVNGQKLMTAYLISSIASRNADEKRREWIKGWLEAVAGADLTNVVSADELALAAYQSADAELAKQWIERAGSSVFAKWLRAKVLTREGEFDKALVLFQAVSRAFPAGADFGQAGDSFVSDLFMNDEFGREECPISRHVLGEIAVVQLVRHEYVLSLDAFLRAGYWGDAAYVAERVLTVDELKNYVDTTWPELPAVDSAADENNLDTTDYSLTGLLKRETTDAALSGKIRYLLARRLTRSLRGEEARPYYPAEYLGKFDALAEALRAGWNSNAPTNEQAENLFSAATIVRNDGMELLGTELGPDYHIHDGESETGVRWQDRVSTNAGFKVLAASGDEISRAERHNADPEQRFHYRYQAAFLAWEAARHMPNNCDDTAKVLAMAGSWLKERDSETADIFYKALVRRNRLTELGAEADRRRWFPEIDGDGSLFAPDSKPEATDQRETQRNGESPAEPTVDHPEEAGDAGATLVEAPVPDGGADSEQASTESSPVEAPSEEEVLVYVVQAGDTLASICRLCGEQGLSVTVQALAEANGGIDPRTIQIGQTLVIPRPR
jgi:nucleoid-associated protein YgaU